MTKLKIDLRNGILEVEGEEAFVREVYQDYKEKITQENFEPIVEEPASLIDKSKATTNKVRRVKNRGAKTRTKRKESYQIVKDLNLFAKDEKEALKSFYSKKTPSTAMESNAVFVYYLQKIVGIKGINVNHIYTCYKEVSEKIPRALRQSLADTSSIKGWIDTKSMDSITITTQGENIVEHELTAKKEQK